MSTLPLIQQFANDLGITQPVNGSWIQAIAQYYDPAEATDDWLAAWANAAGVTAPVNGSWIQAICLSENITEPVNGSWWQALVDGGATPPPPPPPGPLDINSLKYYWKSDYGVTLSGSNVTVWEDFLNDVPVSTFAATDPTYISTDSDFNNNPTLVFDGDNGLRNENITGINWPDGLSIAAIYAPVKTGVSAWQMVCGDSIGNRETMLVSAAPGAPDTLGVYAFQIGEPANFLNTGLSYDNNELILHITVQNNAEGRFLQYINSTTPAYDQLGSFGGGRTSLQIYVGGYGSGSSIGLYFPGKIAEVMVFNQPLSSNDIDILYNYTIFKYY